jgi:hypothetical protein
MSAHQALTDRCVRRVGASSHWSATSRKPRFRKRCSMLHGAAADVWKLTNEIFRNMMQHAIRSIADSGRCLPLFRDDLARGDEALRLRCGPAFRLCRETRMPQSLREPASSLLASHSRQYFRRRLEMLLQDTHCLGGVPLAKRGQKRSVLSVDQHQPSGVERHRPHCHAQLA